MSKKQQAAEPRTVPKADDVQARSDAELNQTAAEGESTDGAAATHEGDAAPAHSNLAATQFKVTRLKAVAVPLFKLFANQKRYFLFDGVMFLGKKIDDKKDAATLLPVTDLETGEQGQIIVGAVLKSLIEETYEGNSYVGKKFETCLRRRADKEYNTYDLYEIETE